MELLSNVRLRSSNTDERRKDSIKEKFDNRTPIESDYGRLVFSSAFRRLHDKTQLFPLTQNDNIHSRLTHSMEVASVGRSFAVSILNDKKIKDSLHFGGSDSDLLRNLTSLIEVICLSHDIGNPPLGHFGETAIQCYFTSLFNDMKNELKDAKDMESFKKCPHPVIASEIRKCNGDEKKLEEVKEDLLKFVEGGNLTYDYTNFDGNAQGFRVITKLQFLNDLYGLNLTSASLASFIKYPNCTKGDKDNDDVCYHKHGVFVTEANIMKEVMKNCGIDAKSEYVYNRHPFAFLMEASDTICYSLMDVEDAISKGLCTYADIVCLLKATEKGKEIVEKAGSHFCENDLEKKKIVQLRTELMSYLVKTTFKTFSDNYEGICRGEYNEELLEDDEVMKAIKEYTKHHILTNKEIQNLELTGHAVISGLLDYYVNYLFHENKSLRKHCKHIMSKTIFMTTLQEHLDYFGSERKAWNVYDDFDPEELAFEEKFRIIRDYVASMTDKYAVEQYCKLSGHKI